MTFHVKLPLLERLFGEDTPCQDYGLLLGRLLLAVMVWADRAEAKPTVRLIEDVG